MPAARSLRTRAIDERRFHAWLSRHLPAGHEGLLPLGDDAAALRPPRGEVAVLSVDSLVEGTHFLRDSPPQLIGSAAAAVSLSDLAAKGARAGGLLLAIVVPPGTPQGWLEEVSRGAERRMEEFGGRVVGGDTKPGPTRTIVSSIVGWAKPGRLPKRSGARPGDVIATTGVVGRGGVAAARLGRTRRPSRPALIGMLEVHPRIEEGIALAPYAHAMLDTSDGIAEAARLLADAGRVRIEIGDQRLPLAPALRRSEFTAAERRHWQFFGGDYELLVALPQRAFPEAERAVRGRGGRLTSVGTVQRGSGAWLEHNGRLRPMPEAGWQPFARRRRDS